MSLPPLRHPSWLMVAMIGLFGASLTTFMAGAYTASKICIAGVAFLAVMVRRSVRDMP